MINSDFPIQYNQSKYGPYACVLFVLFVLFLIWCFSGGSSTEFIGLAPLDPKTCSNYNGSIYNWSSTTFNPISSNISDSQNPEQTDHQISKPTLEPLTPLIVEEENSISIESSTLENLNPTSQINSDVPTIIDDKMICLGPKKFTPIVPINPIVPSVKTTNRKKGRFVSKGEQICCKTMEEIYGVSFKSIRPDWLSNPETGENLEIDCYNDQLKIGVEYNGEQHYKWPNFTNQTYQQFMDQTRRDTLKIHLCERRGVYLLIVPYTIPHDQIRSFILERLPETLNSKISSINYNEITIS